MRKVSFLAVSNGWSPDHDGGLNRYFTNLFNGLSEIGAVQIEGVTLGPAKGVPSSLHAVSRQDAPAWRRLPRIWFEVLRRSRQADVLVPHFALNVLLPVLVLHRRKRIVFQFHGPWAAEARAAGASKTHTKVKKSLEKLVYRRCDAFIVLSDAFGELLQADYGIPAHRITKIAPGVDTGAFNPAKSEQADGTRTAVCARRLVPRMGIDILIRAWAGVDVDARLVLIGDGHARADLERLVVELGLADKVTFAGRVSDAELQRLYAGASLSVVPTRDLEGFGLVVLESLASGTPVIASSVQGLAEVMAPFAPHLMFKSENVNELARLLQGSLDGSLSVPSQQQCREYAMEFSWEKTAREVVAIYQAETPRSIASIER